MITIKADYKGELNTESIHVASGASITTDAPVDNHGKGAAFSPTDLLAASLGCCMTTLMGIKASKNGFDFKPAPYTVTKVMASDPRRVSEIRIIIDMRMGVYTDRQRKILEDAAINCPVAKSLHGDLHQQVDFLYE